MSQPIESTKTQETSKPKPCCVCKPEKQTRDECILQYGQESGKCDSIIGQYKTYSTDYQAALDSLNKQINDYIGDVQSSQLTQEALAEQQKEQQQQQEPKNSANTRTDISTINKSVIVLYSKNSHMPEILETLRSFELRSSKRGKHDFLILLEARPSNALKTMITVMTSAKVHLVNIRDELRTPKNYKVVIDRSQRQNLMDLGFTDPRRKKVKNIQRFLTQGLFELPQMKPYEYFWLLNDANHRLTCDLVNDPLDAMAEEKRSVGFMFMNSANHPYQIYEPIWSELKKYHRDKGITAESLPLITDRTTDLFNQCLFNSFGLLGYVPFFTSSEYQNIAKFLNDQNGKRNSLLTDSEIFTLALGSLLKKDDFKLFQGIGLSQKEAQKEPLVSCPEDSAFRLRSKCVCNPIKDTLWEEYYDKADESCLAQYYRFQGLSIPQDITDRRVVIQQKKEEEKAKAEEKQKEFDQIMEEAGMPVLELQEGDEPVERYERFGIPTKDDDESSPGPPVADPVPIDEAPATATPVPWEKEVHLFQDISLDPLWRSGDSVLHGTSQIVTNFTALNSDFQLLDNFNSQSVGVGRVSLQVTNNGFNGDWFFIFSPGVVIGGHTDHLVGDFSFTGQLGFRQDRHVDD
ncbi:hypothetical protein WICPIJ_002866 [Wickerhamomyces pijperi]|uniref:Uncharacterized protein n=1 Tax=Wickerhamomyces pijperi TaxID=599730 RepID=A0A9P8QAU2_WICPI|nr:hypothetical protein WICPIJ_002866 [Wickerhamomyces pijperi]